MLLMLHMLVLVPLSSFLLLICVESAEIDIRTHRQSEIATENGTTDSRRNSSDNELQAKGGQESIELKLQRINKLRAEMKELAAQVRMERKRKRNEKRNGQQNGEKVEEFRSIGRQVKRLRQKMQGKMKTIMKRLKHLEGKILEQKQELRKMIRSKERGQQRGGGKPSATATRTTKAKTAQQQKNNEAATSHGQSIAADGEVPVVDGQIRKVPIMPRGDAGSSCQQHNDCRPGHCCHRQAHSGEGSCSLMALKEGIVCVHSCQCESQLLCFRESKQQKLTAVASCKRASADDLLNGLYENGKSVFQDEEEHVTEGNVRRLPTE